MSLILEALRKSEAERRRGQAPGLFTPDANVLMQTTTKKFPVLPVGIVVALVMAIAYGGWSWLQHDAATDSLPTRTGTMATQSATTPSVVTAIPIETKPTEPVTAPPATMAASPTSSTSSTDMPAPIAVPPRNMAAPPIPTSLQALAHQVAAPAAQPSATSEPAAITLAALSSERRSQLPPLKLSMHVYADDPGKRFAIIDGQRITEGSALGDAVVRSIRRDGVLLDIDGSSYLLPRP